MKVKLSPQTRKQAILLCSESTPNISSGQTYIAISTIRSKTYSFIVKILEIVEDSSHNDIPLLEVDKYLSGILSQNDTVDLYPYNLSHAEEITFGISEKNLAITPGNWTASIKDGLLGNIYDVGTEVKSAIDAGKGIMILRGFAIKAQPSLPVEIGPTTQIFLEKYADDELEHMENALEQQKIDRTEQMKLNILQNLIANVKSSNMVQATESLDLNFDSSDPKMLDQSIVGLFTSYELFDEKITDEKKKGFTTSRSFVIHDQGVPKELIEYQMNCHKDHGTVLLRVYHENGVHAEELAEDLQTNIRKLHAGLKGKQKNKEIENQIRTYVLMKGAELKEVAEVQLPMAALYTEISQDYPDWNLSMKKFVKIVKKMVKSGLISEVQKLPTGYYMVLFHPLELTEDPSRLLKFAQTTGVLTKEEIMTKLGWTEFRVKEALDFLVERKMAKIDKSFRLGTRFYFMVK
ncbi:hypothetical protein [Candidatus Lokiarchaeum ossiferum]|uniref:hypothetical protein n=1 Tax=Candidatus Lokiarchaeum ossiferum TaxID=2951803 RepID=UPI00352F44A7